MIRLRNIVLYRFLASLLFLLVLFFEGMSGMLVATILSGILSVLIYSGINLVSIDFKLYCFILCIPIFIFLIRLISDIIIHDVLHSRVWIDNNFYLKRYFGMKLYD